VKSFRVIVLFVSVALFSAVVGGISSLALAPYILEERNAEGNIGQTAYSVGNNSLPAAALSAIGSEESPVKENYPAVAISKNLAPAVVGVANFQNRGRIFERTTGLVEVGSGSGFIIDAGKGLILTNYHVINKAEKIMVSLADGRNIEGSLIGGDSRTDLAVLKISAANLSAVTLGDSTQIQVGEPVIAIGNPGGRDFARSVTVGVISATNRFLELQGEASFNLIQTDAAINPGNSGGPLVDYTGKVIGINAAKNQEEGFEGMGFAIPITDAWPTIEQLIDKGYAVHPGILVSVDERYTAELASMKGWPQGVYITAVSPGGPADKAGIRAGDVITKINGAELSSSLELTHHLFKYKVGDTVIITYYRQGATKDVKVTLAELKS